MRKEIWKDVIGFEGLYRISNYGNTKSVDRKVYHSGNNKFHDLKGAMLSTRINNAGYVSVRLNKKGKTYTRFVHRLMAKAFIPNPLNKKYINHRDGDKRNNILKNLEWVTHSENIRHAYRLGLIPSYKYIPSNIRRTFCDQKKNSENENGKREN
ncbi:MAG: NUMOD4 motif-containing HNH endonuclease [Chitinophagaceae bacterium]|nr:NUMOD4 motif-containing HNH endonuclease [Chitinophagaceae bacterium]